MSCKVKLVSLVFAVIVPLALAACGDSGSDSAPSSTPRTTPQVESQPSDANSNTGTDSSETESATRSFSTTAQVDDEQHPATVRVSIDVGDCTPTQSGTTEFQVSLDDCVTAGEEVVEAPYGFNRDGNKPYDFLLIWKNSGADQCMGRPYCTVTLQMFPDPMGETLQKGEEGALRISSAGMVFNTGDLTIIGVRDRNDTGGWREVFGKATLDPSGTAPSDAEILSAIDR